MAGEATLSDGERLVMKLHPHWKTLLRPILIMALIVVAALALLIFFPPDAHTALVRLGIGAARPDRDHDLVHGSAAAMVDDQL